MPINIPIPSESAVASYSWTDVASGTGMVRFYIVFTGGTSFVLVEKPYVGAQLNARYMMGTTTVDLTPFNTPRIVGGYAVATCGNVQTSSGNGTLSVQFFKYTAGGVETSISSNITSPATSSGNAHIVQVPITNTNFARGDLLRVKVGAGGTNAQAWCDPVTAGKEFVIDVPFRIDL